AYSRACTGGSRMLLWLFAFKTARVITIGTIKLLRSSIEMFCAFSRLMAIRKGCLAAFFTGIYFLNTQRGGHLWLILTMHLLGNAEH
ncbi:hypothetical protein JV213_07900, partial [Plesiomonas shigelloides]|uniref:hypothetical protein n=1 Tax=Plesiomonas shigelloides TaxID=703 RepID=UPI001C04CC36